MTSRFLLLRNTLHKGAFRFDLDNDLWKRHYIPDEEEAGNVLDIFQNGSLKGYTIYSEELLHDGVKVYRVLEICAESREVFAELTKQLVERAVKEGVDFVYTKGSDEKFNDVLTERGFFSFFESVAMIALLNPIELFSSLSEEVNQGKTLNIVIKGFDPILLRVGEKGIMVVANEKPDLTVTTDSKTFVKLFFGKTSFFKQLVKGKIGINRMSRLLTAMHFFGLIKQKSWYIPMGDWL